MRLPSILAAAAALLAAAPAAAEDFTILIYESSAELALRTDAGAPGKAYWADYATYGEMLAKSGAMRGGAALATAPNAEGAQLSGYFIVSAADRASAEALAKAAPANRRGGRAELRSQLPTMAAAR